MSEGKFEWTDELVKEYGDWVSRHSEVFASNPLILVEKFKALKQPKPVLFTTEDGVKIHDGDTFWCVHDGFAITNRVADNRRLYDMGRCKDFSTQEAARKYVEENKPKPLFTTEEIAALSEILSTPLKTD